MTSSKAVKIIFFIGNPPAEELQKPCHLTFYMEIVCLGGRKHGFYTGYAVQQCLIVFYQRVNRQTGRNFSYIKFSKIFSNILKQQRSFPLLEGIGG